MKLRSHWYIALSETSDCNSETNWKTDAFQNLFSRFLSSRVSLVSGNMYNYYSYYIYIVSIVYGYIHIYCGFCQIEDVKLGIWRDSKLPSVLLDSKKNSPSKFTRWVAAPICRLPSPSPLWLSSWPNRQRRLWDLHAWRVALSMWNSCYKLERSLGWQSFGIPWWISWEDSPSRF